jgi:hypothetical protein
MQKAEMRKIKPIEMVSPSTSKESTSIHWTTKPDKPEFTANQYNKDDVTILLGESNRKYRKAEMTNMKSMETVSPTTSSESTCKQKKENRLKKSNAKQTVSPSSSVTKVRTFKVSGIVYAYHISLDRSGRLWACVGDDNLVQTDLQRNMLQKIKTRDRYGYHTVTQNCELIFTEKDNATSRW